MPHWLVIDLEATTEEGGWPVSDMEIIEIGASLVDSAGHETSYFQRFVRPVRRPNLTLFCRQLTHINQTDIDAAVTFEVIWEQFERWLHSQQKNLLGWVSWGDYDREQIEQEWLNHRLSSQLSDVPHYNLKKCFAEARQLPRPVGLKAALQLAGLHFQGQQHRALTDARNTARLLPLVLPRQSR